MLHLLNYLPNQLAQYIKDKNKKIYIYGAGMIGRIVIPDYLVRNNIQDKVICYIDSDIRKHGDTVTVGERKITICSLEDIVEWNQDIVLIITNSNYSEIVSQFDTLEYMNCIDAVIYPIIEAVKVENKKNNSAEVLVDYCSNKIPKVIHYCWFSGNPIPDYLKKCMESWSEICPDYEIKRWDESNYNVEKNSYMKQAYEECKWGFVPDYARLDILYNYGGFYIDTDVQLVKSLEPLRVQGGFCGVEKWGNVNMGGCSGAVKYHPMIKKMLDYRADIQFKYEDGTLNLNTCGVYETQPFINLGMRVDNTTQRINDMTVFSSDYFHPYDYMSEKTVITENTFSIHHFNGGWLDEKSRNIRMMTSQKYNHVIERMEKANE